MREQFFQTLRNHGLQGHSTSYHTCGDVSYAIASGPDGERLVLQGEDAGFAGVRLEDGILVCEMNHENRLALQERFSFVAPCSMRDKPFTIGLGDRLGIVTKAHIAAVRGTKFFPVLAQQSKRELSLEKRSYSEMLDQVAYQVFLTGYHEGYAADGDHLKTVEDIRAAIRDGATMITLDCVEHADDLVDFVQTVYEAAIAPAPQDIFFEVSLDEGEALTTPAMHRELIETLAARGVRVDSVAPKFYGAFEKGIPYIGDRAMFERQLREHEEIAGSFGHKISIHSGSDKFNIYPTIGHICQEGFHIKTSGTSWLEALRVIAIAEPDLFSEMANYAVEHFDEASAQYHVSTNPDTARKLLQLEPVADVSLLDQLDLRQIMHVAFGILLNDTAEDGAYLFRDRIYSVLHKQEGALMHVISRHIRKHVHLLS